MKRLMAKSGRNALKLVNYKEKSMLNLTPSKPLDSVQIKTCYFSSKQMLEKEVILRKKTNKKKYESMINLSKFS